MRQEPDRIRSMVCATGLAAAIALTAGLASAQEPTEAAPESSFVVHEWGTFTSMQGSDGHVLEGLHHEEEALPAFVHDATDLLDLGTSKGTKFPASRVVQKMETPVVYFYSDIRRRVDVDVFYLKGLFTQYYPAPHSITPQLTELQRRIHEGRIDFSKLRVSNIRWTVDLLPHREGVPAGIPEVDAEDPWAFAREVGSAFVRRAALRPEENGSEETEHYIFYRGLSAQRLPIAVTASPGDAATLRSGFHHPVPMALALEVVDDRARFRPLGAVDSGNPVGLRLGDEPFRDLDEVVVEVRGLVAKAIVEEGLFEDEARAMVRTWSRQWFRSEGHRVIYLVPKQTIDSRLPLIVNPAPDSMVRVLVGRLEYLTPERERAVEAALRRRLADDEAVRSAAEDALAALGRFLEPQLRRALTASPDPDVKTSAAALLTQIEQARSPEEAVATDELASRGH